MTISFNTIPSNTLVPLFYAEMDNQAANTAQDSGASLLIGHANNGAEIVANSLVLMPSADYARQICGAGSQLARMVEAYRQTDPFGELYVIADADIIYMTRVQRERFTDLMEYEKVKNVYILHEQMLHKTKETMKILHPLPRVNEIAYDVDSSPKAYYFQQAKNGLYARQAIICDVLGITFDEIANDNTIIE